MYSLLIIISSISLRTGPVYLSSNQNHDLTSYFTVFYNASIPNFSAEHLPFAFSAIVVAIIFILMPLLLLLLYPSKATTRMELWELQIGDILLDFACVMIVIATVILSHKMFPLRILIFGVASLLFALLRPDKENWISIM